MTRFAEFFLDMLNYQADSDDSLFNTLLMNGADDGIMNFTVNHRKIHPDHVNVKNHLRSSICSSNPAFALWIINWAKISWSDIYERCDFILQSIAELYPDDAVAIITTLEIPCGDYRCMPIIYHIARHTGYEPAQRFVDHFKLTAANTTEYDHANVVKAFCESNRINTAQWWVDTFEIIDIHDDRLRPWEGPLVKRAL